MKFLMALTAVRAYFFISNEFVNANKFEATHMIAGLKKTHPMDYIPNIPLKISRLWSCLAFFSAACCSSMRFCS